MNIQTKLTEGCDKLSRIYGKMFNFLQEMMNDESKLKKLSPLDLSALGLYIGKFVEQEINSSVVQIMRAFCGIDMPEYYCKRYPDFDIDADVIYHKKRIRLNEQKYPKIISSLKTIPLGDSFYALEELKKEDKDGFFTKYPWLYDRIFLEAWRNLFTFRNMMAHTGEIIDVTTLKENYKYFTIFLRYMPDIFNAKKELAPVDYIESLPTAQEEKEAENPYFVSTDHRDKPYAPKNVAQRYLDLIGSIVMDERVMGELNDILTKYNLDAIIFSGRDGKKGLKDCLGNILVPAKYDGFGFLPQPLEIKRESVIAIRDKKYVLVQLDGSGKELTKEPLDDIRLVTYAHPNPPYAYRNKGTLAWGFMNIDGQVICDCIVDYYSSVNNSAWYRSGELQGYWKFGEVFLPPIYDNIEMPGDFCDPLLFTLNGEQGYVKQDGSFIPLSELKKLDEDKQGDILWECIKEQDDF